MRWGIRLLSTALWLPFFAVPALAQTAPSTAAPAAGVRPYFVGGLAFEHRNLSIKGERSWGPAPVAGAGVWFGRFIAADATIEVGRSQSFDYGTSYSAPIRHRTGTHRDTMILGSVRVRPACGFPICAELVGGAGIGLHHTSSLIREECGYVGVPQPCTTVNRVDWSESEPAFAMSFGVDFPIGRPSSRVTAMPSVRVSNLRHTYQMHLEGNHEPSLPEDWFVSVGLLISIR
jgi:hypothetical protein